MSDLIILQTDSGFGLSEDDALKNKLSGYAVRNYADGRTIEVKSFYRYPDPEIIIRTYPFLALDLVGIFADPERTMRAFGYIQSFDLPMATPPQGYVLESDDAPLPWVLQYQISAVSRDPRHDRALTRMLFFMFPNQYGFLDMSYIDGTTRRADLIGQPQRMDSMDENQKRIYRNIFTINVSAEFYLSKVVNVAQVNNINFDFEFPFTGEE